MSGGSDLGGASASSLSKSFLSQTLAFSKRKPCERDRPEEIQLTESSREWELSPGVEFHSMGQRTQQKWVPSKAFCPGSAELALLVGLEHELRLIFMNLPYFSWTLGVETTVSSTTRRVEHRNATFSLSLLFSFWLSFLNTCPMVFVLLFIWFCSLATLPQNLFFWEPSGSLTTHSWPPFLFFYCLYLAQCLTPHHVSFILSSSPLALLPGHVMEVKEKCGGGHKWKGRNVWPLWFVLNYVVGTIFLGPDCERPNFKFITM